MKGKKLSNPFVGRLNIITTNRSPKNSQQPKMRWRMSRNQFFKKCSLATFFRDQNRGALSRPKNSRNPNSFASSGDFFQIWLYIRPHFKFPPQKWLVIGPLFLKFLPPKRLLIRPHGDFVQGLITGLPCFGKRSKLWLEIPCGVRNEWHLRYDSLWRYPSTCIHSTQIQGVPVLTFVSKTVWYKKRKIRS